MLFAFFFWPDNLHEQKSVNGSSLVRNKKSMTGGQSSPFLLYLFSLFGQVRASYLEVYEERVYDLLDASNRNKPMEEWATVSLSSDAEGNQVLKGLATFDVDNEGERRQTELLRKRDIPCLAPCLTSR